MRVASCALRILDKCNIFRACWFIALTFSQPQKKEKVGKLLTFQISRTKAKSNQTEWSNQYNKPTTCGAYFVVVTEETSIKENGAYTHDWSVRLMHLQYVRTFCVHDTINTRCQRNGVKEKTMQLITHYLPPQRLLYIPFYLQYFCLGSCVSHSCLLKCNLKCTQCVVWFSLSLVIVHMR